MPYQYFLFDVKNYRKVSVMRICGSTQVLPEYEDRRVGDPVLPVQVRPLLNVATPGQNLALLAVDQAQAAFLTTHGEPAVMLG